MLFRSTTSITGTLTKNCPVSGTAYAFTAAKVTGAVSYVWTTPACATSDNSITNVVSVKFGTKGGIRDTLFVQAKNSAGCLSVKKGVPVTTLTTCTSCYTVAMANTQIHIAENEQPVREASLHMNVYPNPTSGKFTLSINGFDDGQAMIKVTDPYGAVLFSREQYLKRGVAVTQIDLGRNKSKGIYFIQVMQRDKVKLLKIMKD